MKNAFLYLIFIYIITSSCNKQKAHSKPLILCTTNIVADLVKNICGTQAQVKTLMSSGVDPHVYKASQGDIFKMYNADMIICNGLHLEGKLAEMLQKFSKIKPVYELASYLNSKLLIQTDEKYKIYDPHIWFDVNIWKQCGEGLVKFLNKNPLFNKDTLNKKSIQYFKQLIALDSNIILEFKKSNNQNKILITSHDAFNYYGKRYHINVIGLQGISTMADYGIKEVTQLADYIINHKVKTIFVENSVSNKSITSVIEACKVKKYKVNIGGSLYTDALAEPNSPEGTYIGMIQYNNKLIFKSINL